MDPLKPLKERMPEVPLPLQRRSNDEFSPPPYSATDHRVLAKVKSDGPEAARRVNRSLADYWSSRRGTASALRAIDEAHGGGFYTLPSEATLDQAAADTALGGDETVIDVQTHYISDHSTYTLPLNGYLSDQRAKAKLHATAAVLTMLQNVAPERFKELNGERGLLLTEFLRCVYLESETAVAVLTSAPGDAQRNFLTNDEIAGTRELVDRLAGTGRLLNHSIVHPNKPGELEHMARIKERYHPVGWKVYTHHGNDQWPGGEGGWMLDDERFGLPFLEGSRKIGVNMVCVHKGFSNLAPTGAPKDIGPAAKAFPDVSFMVYHSGYEIPRDEVGEGPYSKATAHLGSNRLVKTLKDAGIPPGRNVYAELGSTWFCLMRRPVEAAHVLGKLIKAMGEDNVLWGTDSIWYGSPQPLIDAFRVFQIPERMREKYGYPRLTKAFKAKALGLNAARVYGIDIKQARARADADDLAWVKKALDHYKAKGTPCLA